MRIDVTTISPNVSGTAKQSAGDPVQVPKQGVIPAQAQKKDIIPEGTREIVHKPKSELSMDEKQWIKVIEKANKAIDGATSTFEFSIHARTKQIMVKVIDKETKEVIREFPPEKILDMIAKMWEVAGIIVDERR